MTTWQIIPLMEEDKADAEVAAEVEATGKMAALAGAAKGLGGHVSRIKSYQNNRPVLWLEDRPWIARRRTR